MIKLAAPKPKARGNYDHTGVLTAAAQAIAQGWGGDAQVLAFLQDLAVNDPEPTARAMALQAIAQGWGDDRVLGFLQDRAVNDPEPTARAMALQAIAQGWAATTGFWAFSRTVPSMTRSRPRALWRCRPS